MYIKPFMYCKFDIKWGYTTLWHDHFVVALFCIAHFGVDLFGTNFLRIIYFFFQFFNFNL